MKTTQHKLTFISTSKGKAQELLHVLKPFSTKEIELPEIQAETIDEIIRHKLLVARENTNGSIFVEDTSLAFSALGTLPGPYIKWFLKALGNDGLTDLALKLDSQAATAISVIGCWLEGTSEPEFFRGEVSGTIVTAAGSGFGWDCIFRPNGSEKTFGQMKIEEKDQFSHRGKAARLFRTFLERVSTSDL